MDANAGISIEVSDRDGWRKTFSVDKRIIYIGNAPGNDVVLEAGRGAGVSAKHIQLIVLEGGGCRLINLGETELSGSAPVAPRAIVDVADGQQLRAGEFTLTLRIHTAARPDARLSAPLAGAGSSASIGLTLQLPRRQIAPGELLEGTILVQNRGEQPGVQFTLTLSGLDPACYELGAAPLLFPNAQKAVPLRLRHTLSATPRAGKYRLAVRAAAPEAYPGEAAEAVQELEILPYYQHALRLVSVDNYE